MNNHRTIRKMQKLILFGEHLLNSALLLVMLKDFLMLGDRIVVLNFYGLKLAEVLANNLKAWKLIFWDNFGRIFRRFLVNRLLILTFWKLFDKFTLGVGGMKWSFLNIPLLIIHFIFIGRIVIRFPIVRFSVDFWYGFKGLSLISFLGFHWNIIFFILILALALFIIIFRFFSPRLHIETNSFILCQITSIWAWWLYLLISFHNIHYSLG